MKLSSESFVTSVKKYLQNHSMGIAGLIRTYCIIQSAIILNDTFLDSN